MIEPLIEALQAAGLVLSGQDPAEPQSLLQDEDIADALWLAAHMGEAAAGAPAAESLTQADPEFQPQPGPAPESLAPESQDPESVAPESQDPEPPATPPTPTVAAYRPESLPPAPDDAAPPESGLPLSLQAAPALPNARAMGRALRSLMRNAPSRTEQVLDEAATVERIAQEDLWIPVLQPAPERWFDLELVIEASPFSFVWESTLAEFQQLLEQQGAFRTVRTWSVVAVAAEPQLFSKARLPDPELPLVAPAAPARSPRELIDASGRALVLYVSDCRSKLWQHGTIHPWLKLWGDHGPTTVVQLLPERLWHQSELNQGFKVQVSAFTPGAANPNLQLYDSPRRRPSTHSSLTLPVVTLTPRALQQWARVVTAAGQQRLPGRLLDLLRVQADEYPPEAGWDVITPQTPEARLELFQATASPPAQRLARLMSVVPLDLAVVHLLQKTFFGDRADPVHVAEVYDSCLVEPAGPGGPYRFAAGVRELLNRANPIDETLDVLEVLSQEIARTLGFEIHSFTALLYPKADWNTAERATILPFARIATQVLHRLGGQYADLARQVEQDAATVPGWLQAESAAASEEPEIEGGLKTDEFTIATVIVEPARQLQTFEFTTATLMRRSGAGQFQGQGVRVEGRWLVQLQGRSGQRFYQALSPQLALEMVVIPAGEFTMGSPPDEPERESWEGPRRRVRVEAFCLGRYPVTQAQWRFVASLEPVNRELTPAPAEFVGEPRPVERVSWYEAVEFCDRISRHTGRPYRLPTEAEWEYACRAGTETPFHFGPTLTPTLVNYNGNYSYNGGPKGAYRRETTPVGSTEVDNDFGLGDMHGNVWEWCQDPWHDSYTGAPSDAQAWALDAELEPQRRVRRGGAWSVLAWDCRSACRDGGAPSAQNNAVGFRVACGFSLPSSPAPAPQTDNFH